MSRIISLFTLIFFLQATPDLFATIINVPNEFETIQGAINAAGVRDTVLVQPGEYVENIDFSGKLIVVASLFLTTGDPEFIAATIIDGNEEGRVVSFTDLENRHSVLNGFTIRNGSTIYGGGIYIRGASPTISNLIVTQNSATHRAGGIYCTQGSNPTLNNVTVVGNRAGDNQGGIHAFQNSNPIVVNSIFRDNDPPEIPQAVEITFSNVEGGFEGEGNIDADPLFVDLENGDYTLTEDSPCIDAGTDVGLPFRGEAPDMGAIESIPEERERHFQFTRTDNNHSLIIIEVILSGEILPNGDEIGVFSPDGFCCGAEAWEGERLGLAAWGDDPQTEEIDGLRDGEEMAFRLWDWQSGMEYRANPNIEQGDAVFHINEFSVLSLEGVINRHWQEPEQTDNSHSLLVTGATLDGEPLAVGNEIGVFTEAELLAGWAILLDEEHVGIAAWGDNEHTEEVVEGFVVDEPFTFLVWDHINETESPAEAQFSRGPEVYTPNGFSVLELEAIRVPVIPELAVQLNRGWNMISINLAPPEVFYSEEEERGPDIALMADQLVDQGVLVMMKNGDGQFYAPEHDFNNIPYWNLNEGYQIDVTEDVTATWVGEPIPRDTDIPLGEGWNMIAYLPGYALSCESPDFVALSPILDNVIIAKDAGGHFAAPEFNYSNMPPWRETQGYMVRVDGDVVLNYPEEQEEQQASLPISRPNLVHFATVTPTNSNMSVLLRDVQFDGEVGAFTNDGLCVGASVLTNGSVGIAVWGDDSSTDAVDGLLEGEAFELRWWSPDNRKEQKLSPIKFLAGESLLYAEDGLLVLEVDAVVSIPNEFYLSECYPNPFNNTARLNYDLPEGASVKIQAFDLSGRLVTTLINSKYEAGHHYVTWDATGLATGIYLVQMRAGEFESVRKVTLLK